MISDKERLSQILLNLLLNALKFTNEGTITLEVFVTVDNTVKFKVKDTGCGIEESRLPYIFNLFENNSGNINHFLQVNHKCKLNKFNFFSCKNGSANKLKLVLNDGWTNICKVLNRCW